MRELKNSDIYLISEISYKMDMELPEKQKLTGKETAEEIKERRQQYGAKLVKTFMRNMFKAKDSLNELIASITDKSPEEVAKMSGTETMNVLMSFFGEAGFVDFFI